MNKEMKEIPLFPLGLVVYPNSVYPLHIFEERYKNMIGRCLKNNEPFGIVASIEKEMFEVGCLVKIRDILKRYNDGRLDITVIGIERFQTITTVNNEAGYIQGDLESYTDDVNPDVKPETYFEVINKFKRILSKTEILLTERYWKNLDTAELKSFKIAEKAGLSLKQQQFLLSLKSEKARINMLSTHFNKIEEYLDSSETINDIIQGDGYIN